MTLPGSPHIAHRDNALFIEGCEVAALAREFGTPLYVYARASLLDALAAYQRALKRRDHLPELRPRRLVVVVVEVL